MRLPRKDKHGPIVFSCVTEPYGRSPPGRKIRMSLHPELDSNPKAPLGRKRFKHRVAYAPSNTHNYRYFFPSCLGKQDSPGYGDTEGDAIEWLLDEEVDGD